MSDTDENQNGFDLDDLPSFEGQVCFKGDYEPIEIDND